MHARMNARMHEITSPLHPPTRVSVYASLHPSIYACMHPCIPVHPSIHGRARCARSNSLTLSYVSSVSPLAFCCYSPSSSCHEQHVGRMRGVCQHVHACVQRGCIPICTYIPVCVRVCLQVRACVRACIPACACMHSCEHMLLRVRMRTRAYACADNLRRGHCSC